MTQKHHLTIKWLVIAVVTLFLIAVMYYKHRPIKEVEQPKNNFPVYSPYKNY